VKTFAAIMTAISAMYAALMASAIYEKQGTGRTILYCALGVAAIWVIGYLKARLFGWIEPGKGDRERPD
jgi:hypothetical protein